MKTPAADDFLDLLYDAVIEPDLWARVLEKLGDEVGGGPAILTTLDRVTGAGSVLTARVGLDTVDDYISYYAEKNPLLASARRADYAACWTQRVVVDEQVIERKAFAASEYYNDFLRPIAAEWKMIFRLDLKGSHLSALVIARAEGRGRFTEEAVARANQLSPHLTRVFALSRKLALTRGALDDPLGDLERSQKALVVLDDEGRIRHANARADGLLTQDRRITVRNGRLACQDPNEDWRLSSLLSAARSHDPQRRQGGSMRLTGRHASPSLSIGVSPVRSDRLAGFFAAATASLVCLEPAEAGTEREGRLREMFSLTGAESRVALALYQGSSPSQIAARLNVSVNTVRAQLAAVFAKTGTHRQAELVSRLRSAFSA